MATGPEKTQVEPRGFGGSARNTATLAPDDKVEQAREALMKED